ncbi:M1 family aminopeptidase [Aquimarina rhabdastrellae]
MFTNFFLSELKYALKQPMVYIFFTLIALLSFGAVASDSITIGGAIGNVYKNSPHVITIFTVSLTIFGLVIATAFYNNAALRDYNNHFNEILFSTPLSKFGYFFGRFFGALLLSTIPLLGIYFGVFMGTILAPALGWVSADRFGDFYLETIVNNYFIFILPNMFFAGSVIFAMANKWRSTTISFLGALLIIVGYIISGTLLSDIDSETTAALIDTFGIRTYSLHAKYFTPIEKNTLSPTFSGLILLNRVIWIAVGLVILLLSYFSFSFKERNKKVKKQKEKDQKATQVFELPQLTLSYSKKGDWNQFKSFFVINFINIIKSVTFRIIFFFSAIILISNLTNRFEYYGLQTYPLTYKIIDAISGSSTIFAIIIVIFFSGEIIWRDRDNKINEVIDATPHASLISIVAKSLSLISVVTILHIFFVFCGILYQLLNGFTAIEMSQYFLSFIYENLTTYIFWSIFSITIQVILNNKYIGYTITIILLLVSDMILSAFDIETYMLYMGAIPNVTYSDMNTFGPATEGVIWFSLYWGFIALICLFIAGSLWSRGTTRSLKDRILSSKKQLPKYYRFLMMGVVTCWVGIAGYVYYNTQILNEYLTSDQVELLSADYEKKYKKYENSPLPKIAKVKYAIDIFPHQRDVKVKADMTLVNETKTAIDSIHYTIDSDWNPKITIPNAQLVLDDTEFNYRIYKLATPLQPGEQLAITIQTEYITQGFENQVSNTNIVKNGTFLNNFQILPSLGYRSNLELTDKNTRKKYDLAPKDRLPKLTANCTDQCMQNYLSNGTADYIDVETIISTANDQIAIAPGSKIKEWKENDRKYYHYKVDHISQNFYSFMSAAYQVKSRKWNGVDIEVYYDEKHPQNIDMMLDATQRSLAYYSENFGPYMHKQCRIIEFPRYATFAQAFPGTMPYSEGFGFIINLEDENENNVIDAVISHEMAHQWWAHQVVGATMQGSTMLSESFSEYSSLMTMKSIAKTPMKMREFLKYDHDRYLRGRSNELIEELPLYKVENQSYLHYGKGSVILYALQDYIGEDKVNAAMREFLEEYKYKKPPYPTSLDFMKYLEPKVPDSLNYLIKDMFKEITLYDNRLKEASYKKLANGKYEISMKIESKKLLADAHGNESETTIDDWIDLGAFGDDDEEDLIFEKRVKIDKSKMDFTFEIDSLPAKLAIDPRHLLIDRIYSDNIKRATEATTDQTE